MKGSVDDSAAGVAVSVGGSPDQTTSGLAVGFILFAAIMMIRVGI
jgi:hypothetical protein